jgi:hypothetical protein
MKRKTAFSGSRFLLPGKYGKKREMARNCLTAQRELAIVSLLKIDFIQQNY